MSINKEDTSKEVVNKEVWEDRKLTRDIEHEGSKETEYKELKEIEKDLFSLKEASNKKLKLLKQTGLGDTTRYLPRQATNNVASNRNLPMSRSTGLGTTPRTLPRQAGAAFVDTENVQNVQEVQVEE